jgi:DNA-binding XRE family transcriptional regulator
LPEGQGEHREARLEGNFRQEIDRKGIPPSPPVGKRIKVLHLKLQLSQDEFARKADIPYTTLTKIETGVIKKPSVFVMAKIAKALNITVDELIK